MNPPSEKVSQTPQSSASSPNPPNESAATPMEESPTLQSPKRPAASAKSASKSAAKSGLQIVSHSSAKVKAAQDNSTDSATDSAESAEPAIAEQKAASTAKTKAKVVAATATVEPSDTQATEAQTAVAKTADADAADADTSEAKESETKEKDRSHPISPPSEPMQYRAIGLIRGRYEGREDHVTKGLIYAADGSKVDAVLLGRVISLVKKHIDLSQEHLWVVYPRTREDGDRLHVQIVGIWEPESLSQDGEEGPVGEEQESPTTPPPPEAAATPEATTPLEAAATPEATEMPEVPATTPPEAPAASAPAAEVETTETTEAATTEATTTETTTTEAATTEAATTETATTEAATTETAITEAATTEAATTEAATTETTDAAVTPSPAASPTANAAAAASGAETTAVARVTNAANTDLEDGFFSIRGEVIHYNQEANKLVIKIRQQPRKKSDQPKAFKLTLKGMLDSPKLLRHFWEVEAQREGDDLVVQRGTLIGIMPPVKKKDRPPGSDRDRSAQKKRLPNANKKFKRPHQSAGPTEQGAEAGSPRSGGATPKPMKKRPDPTRRSSPKVPRNPL